MHKASFYIFGMFVHNHTNQATTIVYFRTSKRPKLARPGLERSPGVPFTAESIVFNVKEETREQKN